MYPSFASGVKGGGVIFDFLPGIWGICFVAAAKFLGIDLGVVHLLGF